MFNRISLIIKIREKLYPVIPHQLGWSYYCWIMKSFADIVYQWNWLQPFLGRKAWNWWVLCDIFPGNCTMYIQVIRSSILRNTGCNKKKYVLYFTTLCYLKKLYRKMSVQTLKFLASNIDYYWIMIVINEPWNTSRSVEL